MIEKSRDKHPGRSGALVSISKYIECKQHVSKTLLVPGSLNGRSIMAIADTGSDYNLISASFARQNNIKVELSRTSSQDLLQIASGAYISAIGQVTLLWAFKNEAEELQLIFYILEQRSSNVIIGHNTLLYTDTMTLNDHRLLHTTMPYSHAFDANHVPGGKNPAQGTSNFHKIHAIPDTGSQRNILSIDCARRLGLSIQRAESARVCLRFPDGSTAITIGTVHAFWRFPNHHGACRMLWDILPGFPREALLGADFLCRRNVYKKYPESFTEEIEPRSAPEFYNIEKNPGYVKEVAKTPVPERQPLPGILDVALRKKLEIPTISYSESSRLVREEEQAIGRLFGTAKRNGEVYESRRKISYNREMNMQWDINIEISQTTLNSHPSQSVKAMVELERREKMLPELNGQTREYRRIRTAPLKEQGELFKRELLRQRIFLFKLECEKIIAEKRFERVMTYLQLAVQAKCLAQEEEKRIKEEEKRRNEEEKRIKEEEKRGKKEENKVKHGSRFWRR